MLDIYFLNITTQFPEPPTPSQSSYHLPHLHDVVLWYRADDPRLVGVPREVWDLSRVSAVDELKRNRAGEITVALEIQFRPHKDQQRSRLSQLTSNSGGPSSASSGDCSSPILLRSHTLSLLSVPLEARMVSLWGDHWTCWAEMGQMLHFCDRVLDKHKTNSHSQHD